MFLLTLIWMVAKPVLRGSFFFCIVYKFRYCFIYTRLNVSEYFSFSLHSLASRECKALNIAVSFVGLWFLCVLFILRMFHTILQVELLRYYLICWNFCCRVLFQEFFVFLRYYFLTFVSVCFYPILYCHISRMLLIILNNGVFWIVEIRPPISNSSSLLFKPLGTVQSAQIPVCLILVVSRRSVCNLVFIHNIPKDLYFPLSLGFWFSLDLEVLYLPLFVFFIFHNGHGANLNVQIHSYVLGEYSYCIGFSPFYFFANSFMSSMYISLWNCTSKFESL